METTYPYNYFRVLVTESFILFPSKSKLLSLPSTRSNSIGIRESEDHASRLKRDEGKVNVPRRDTYLECKAQPRCTALGSTLDGDDDGGGGDGGGGGGGDVDAAAAAAAAAADADGAGSEGDSDGRKDGGERYATDSASCLCE
ncbi:hypothetical protein V1478_005006 [Vespula squamosa]|uniref:Uncharacterized protein n=1 Tax=Vespula squamosa TaxID=30214 RepID=A0ABD2BFC5_VESSQ